MNADALELERPKGPRAQLEVPPVRVVASGVDTLHLFSHALADRLRVRELEVAQEVARHAEDHRAPGPVVDLGGHYLHMQRHGARTAPYLLESDHLVVLCNPGAVSTFPTATVELRSVYLWQVGAHRAAQEAGAIFDRLLMRLSDEERENRVGRLDLCVDFQGWQPDGTEGERFKTRAGDRAAHWGRIPPGASWARRGRRVDDTRIFTGYLFGHGDVAARLYNKSVEIEKSGKQWFRDVWSKSPLYQPSEPVWRLEFQLRRAGMRELEEKGQGALATVEQVLAKLRGLWSYLSTGWLSLRLPRTCRSRQTIHPAWAQLAAQGFRDEVWEGTDADLYRRQREDLAARATGQLAGYLARGYAEELFQTETADAAKGLTFDKVVPRLLSRAKRHAEARGHPLEERGRERYGAWLLNAESMRAGPELRIPEPGELDGDDDQEGAAA